MPPTETPESKVCVKLLNQTYDAKECVKLLSQTPALLKIVTTLSKPNTCNEAASLPPQQDPVPGKS